MKYAIYTSSGDLVRTVTCPPELIQLQLGEGESSVECGPEVAADTHRVEDGELVALPPPSPPPPPTEAQVRVRLVSAAQRLLDSKAREWGYDDMRSAVSYVGDPHPRFNAEGLALRDWRSSVWSFLDGQSALPLPSPTPEISEFLAQLPSAPVRPS